MTTVFVHIPRTAGTSFRIWAEEILNKKTILAIYGSDLTVAPQIMSAAKTGDYSLIRGHFTASCLTAEYLKEICFTILRNPIDRVTSLYKYIRRDGKHPIHSKVMEMTLVEYASSGISLESDNGMVRQLCGKEPELPQRAYSPEAYPEHTPFGELTRESLIDALAILHQFRVVGVMELMEQSLKLLLAQNKWAPSAPKFPHANTTRKVDITQAQRKVLRGLNQLDHELWKYAAGRVGEEMEWLLQ